MRLNILAFNKMFDEQFKGNYHEAARQIGADVAQIHRIVNKKQNFGLVFVERLLEWCVQNNYDYSELIIMPSAMASRIEKE